jgi:hypothetical protein
MGNSAFRRTELPIVVKQKIDEAIGSGMTIIVGDASGASVCLGIKLYPNNNNKLQ